MPRAGVDVIGDAATALAVVMPVVHRPLRHETIVVLLDHARRGVVIGVVTGTREPGHVVEVVECLTTPAALGGQVGAIVVASVRPGRPAAPDDVDRWLELDHVATRAGVDLVEWFVVNAAGVTVPREVLGEPPRWPTGAAPPG